MYRRCLLVLEAEAMATAITITPITIASAIAPRMAITTTDATIFCVSGVIWLAADGLEPAPADAPEELAGPAAIDRRMPNWLIS